MKVTDASTGQLPAGAVDKRVRDVALSSAAQWKWGDAENVMDYGAQKRAPARGAVTRSGVRRALKAAAR